MRVEVLGKEILYLDPCADRICPEGPCIELTADGNCAKSRVHEKID